MTRKKGRRKNKKIGRRGLWSWTWRRRRRRSQTGTRSLHHGRCLSSRRRCLRRCPSSWWTTSRRRARPRPTGRTRRPRRRRMRGPTRRGQLLRWGPQYCRLPRLQHLASRAPRPRGARPPLQPVLTAMPLSRRHHLPPLMAPATPLRPPQAARQSRGAAAVWTTPRPARSSTSCQGPTALRRRPGLVPRRHPAFQCRRTGPGRVSGSSC